MRFAILLLAFASVALAQSSASASAATSKSAAASSASKAASAPAASATGLTSCALTCITEAAKNSSCLTPTNVTCVCTDPNFQAKAATCLQGECKAADSEGALALQKQQCGAASLSATAVPTATAPFLPSNSDADISASGTGASVSAATSGSASAGGKTGGAVHLMATGAGMAALVAVAGGLVGAAFAL
ncbi:hypothetical protein C8R44DRAFT_992410 [Mycena epipterygia]|nr:hypothetical protein C8R44DRAFT_992410 [Mycena epipterygia]